MSAVNEARKTLLVMELTGNEGGLAYDTIHNLLAHIERLEAENTALREQVETLTRERDQARRPWGVSEYTRLLRENAAQSAALEAVRAVCDSQQPRHPYPGQPCDYHCAQQIIAEVRAALAIAQTDERKAETE